MESYAALLQDLDAKIGAGLALFKRDKRDAQDPEERDVDASFFKDLWHGGSRKRYTRRDSNPRTRRTRS
jgi:hypothetical protein